MTIDLKITFDDLSDECKKLINHLKELGYDVELVYPSLQKVNDWSPKWYTTTNDTGGQYIISSDNIKYTNFDIYCEDGITLKSTSGLSC